MIPEKPWEYCIREYQGEAGKLHFQRGSMYGGMYASQITWNRDEAEYLHLRFSLSIKILFRVLHISRRFS